MNKIRGITHIGLMTALIAVMAQITIPLPSGVPVTLQVFAVALSGFLLKWKMGTVAVATYIMLGTVGVPVFAGFQGGFGVITSFTGGFLVGFLPMAFLCGIELKCGYIRLVLSVLAVLLCHLLGVLWFAYVAGIPVWAAFLQSSAWYLAKDAALVLAAEAVAGAVRKSLKRT